MHAESFPIAVAWGGLDISVEYHEIRPELGWLADGRGWDHAATAVHGLTIEHLQTHGRPLSLEGKRGRYPFRSAE